ARVLAHKIRSCYQHIPNTGRRSTVDPLVGWLERETGLERRSTRSFACHDAIFLNVVALPCGACFFSLFPMGAMGDDAMIKIQGARQHNLKNLSLEILRNRFVVITGVSGS